MSLEEYPLLQTLVHWFFDVWHLRLFNSGDTSVYLNQVIIALLVILVGSFIARRTASLLGKRIRQGDKFTANSAYLIQRLVFYSLILLVVFLALPIAGIPVTIFTVLGGGLAIGVGFGAQNLINNLISGFIIMMERPIRIGDIVELEDGERGKIADIGNRSVRIRRTNGVDVLVPNSFFLEQKVVNWTLFDAKLRGEVRVGVAYGSDTRAVHDLMEDAAKQHPDIDKDQEIIVLFEEFGDNCLNFTVLFWTHVKRPMDLRRVQSDLHFTIDQRFREAGIVIAFPQRDLHIDTLSPIDVRLTKDNP